MNFLQFSSNSFTRPERWDMFPAVFSNLKFWDLFCFGPQLQIICCYIARYYVRKIARAPGGGGGGGGRNISPRRWRGGVGQNRIDHSFDTVSPFLIFKSG